MTDRIPSQRDETQVRPLTPDELQDVNGGAFTGGVFVGLAGDADGDGSVDAADYVVWRKSNG